MATAPQRPNTAILVVPLLLIVVTFLFWYQTWFGRRLSNQEMAEYLSDTSVPHKTQHALAQMAERITHGDYSASQWYPQVLALARSPQPQFRMTAAWVMGQDARSAEFHQALRRLLLDSEPAVQWNAALALVRFGDAAGEPQIRLMLQPYTLRASRGGMVNFRLKRGDATDPGIVVARVKPASAGPQEEVRSPLAGEVRDLLVPEGAAVGPDQPLAVVSPGAEQTWECLRGLYFVGIAADADEIESYVRSTPRLPDQIKQQAEVTVQAIRRRVTGNSTER